MYQRALAINEKTYGPDHPAVATSLNELASLYKEQGQYARVEPLYQRSLAIYEKVLGPEHPYVATSLNNLGGLYQAQGEYARVEPLYQRALAINEKTYGPDHPSVATSLISLASLYQAQGQYGRVEPLYQKRPLVIYEKTYGPDHPAVATSLNELGEFFRTLNQYAKAEPLYQRSMAIHEKVLGPEHPYVATSLNNLAKLYCGAGAVRQSRASLPALTCDRSRKPSGPSIPMSLPVSTIWLSFIIPRGSMRKAEPLYERSLAIYEKVLAPEHPYVATSLNNLAGLYQSLGEYEKVLPLRNRALRIAGANNIPETQWRVEDGLRETLARERQTRSGHFLRQAGGQYDPSDARGTYQPRSRAATILSSRQDEGIPRTGRPVDRSRATARGAASSRDAQRRRVLRLHQPCRQRGQPHHRGRLHRRRTILAETLPGDQQPARKRRPRARRARP